ncbi:hypothetical protein M407DRAFT_21090 [Tulasnella calospora MUT 4182]|uniref:Uncharacterized protein n=1 Tax=Tulasnella calospora MUT 4182 TaxID=1051891 RepID=A0A0C3M858_9AGAM|nr:hypothetical protein M407DRAFT_21090 [Tulasnella calospora MUT 4182]
MHALLVEEVLRWKSLRVEATVDLPSELRQWIPSELPNIAGLSLHLVVLGYVPQDDMDSRGPFISAPRLTFCASDSPVTFPLTYCPFLQEYHATGIGFLELIDPSRQAVLFDDYVTRLEEPSLPSG